MNVESPFILRENYNSAVLSLIESVELGSNGTIYQHQKTSEHIQKLYKPLFLNLERKEKVLGNVTICRRPNHWYVRYFAFDMGMQSSRTKKKSKVKSSSLKDKVNSFFEEILKQDEEKVASLYAYIDPRNERSLWMSQTFGFKTIAKIATQTFSRVYPKKQEGVVRSPITTFIKDKIEETYSEYPFYFAKHTFDDNPFYSLTIQGEIVAFAKVFKEEWKMKRLPGKSGGLLVKIIPFIPFIRRIIKPKKHIFSVVDSVWSKNENPDYIQSLFEGILCEEKTNSLIWWVDHKEPIYNSIKSRIKWGLLHQITGVNDVDLVVKSNLEKEEIVGDKPTYVTGFDFI